MNLPPISNFGIFRNSLSRVNVLPFSQKHNRILTIVSLALAFLVASYAIIHYFKINIFSKKNPQVNVQKQNANLNPTWINKNSEVPLTNLGLNDYNTIVNFVKKHGNQLTCLNLGDFEINDAQFKELISLTPNLNFLSIHSKKLTHRALIHLKGLPLTSADFHGCYSLSDLALPHFKGLKHLTRLNLRKCSLSNNNALSHLKGLQLSSLDLSDNVWLTDGALAHLKGMPLTSINFGGCHELTDDALAHLNGMPLKSIDFCNCKQLTDEALSYLKGMPLTIVKFFGCERLTDQALIHLKGMPLKEINFSCCNLMSKKALSDFKMTLGIP